MVVNYLIFALKLLQQATREQGKTEQDHFLSVGSVA
jgi:hypothetical protein